MNDDETQIRTVLTAYGAAMQAMDLSALQACWDADGEHLVYQPEEYARACRSWTEIVAYWSYIPQAVARITQWRELETDVAVVGDAALVYSVLMTTFVLREDDHVLDGEVRFSFGLRRTADGWRLVHCHESRQLVVEDASD